MTAWMRARVSSCTSGDWLITRDTVFLETLARRAMSLIVALRPGLMPVGLPAGIFAAAGAFAATRVPVVLLRVRVMGRGLYGRFARKAGMSPNKRLHATGVMGVVVQRRLPIPVNIASADWPAAMECTPVAAPVETNSPARSGRPRRALHRRANARAASGPP